MAMKKQVKKGRGRPTIPIYNRILNKSHIPKKNGKIDKDACWTWQGGTNNAGYGLIREEGVKKMLLVHRAMGRHIFLKCGPNDEIQHTCLNRLCVNPKHLVNGDVWDRRERMDKAGRFNWNSPFYDKEFMNPTCKHCGETTYLPHFKRKHSLCEYNAKTKYLLQTLPGNHKC